MEEQTRRRIIEHGTLILYSQELFDALWADVVACEEVLANDDLPHVRRQLVRSAFALVEASTFYLKRIAASAARDRSCELHRGVEALLLDESYEVTPEGGIQIRSARISTLSNIRLSLNAFAACVAPGYLPPVSEAGWDAMRKSLKVPDRLMHPKSLQDLQVNNEELQRVRQALTWYRTALAQGFRVAADHSLAKFNELVSKPLEPENTEG